MQKKMRKKDAKKRRKKKTQKKDAKKDARKKREKKTQKCKKLPTSLPGEALKGTKGVNMYLDQRYYEPKDAIGRELFSAGLYLPVVVGVVAGEVVVVAFAVVTGVVVTGEGFNF